MASRKTATPLQQTDIKVDGKSKKHAATLARFVKQEGRAALPLLDDVLAQGTLVMRRAAITQLGQLDPRKAKRHVDDARKALAKKKTTKTSAEDTFELLTWYALIGSPSSLRAFLDEGGRVEDLDLDRATVDSLHELVAAEVPGLDTVAVRRRLEQVSLLDHGGIPHGARKGSAQARALAHALLAHGDDRVRDWGATLLGRVDGIRALDGLRRLGREPGLALLQTLCGGAPVEVQLRELSPFVTRDHERSVVLSLLRAKLDPRWFPLLEPHLSDPGVQSILAASGHQGALGQLRAAADSGTFDRATQHACYALGQAGDREATPILLRWLADPVGRQASPMLLTALGECADARAIPTIERLGKAEPGRANFYAHTVASLRQREG